MRIVQLLFGVWVEYVSWRVTKICFKIRLKAGRLSFNSKSARIYILV